MPDINPAIPQIGQPDSTEEPKVVTALTQLIAAVNNVDTDQIADGTIQAIDLETALLDVLGVTAGGTPRRGKSIIATPESRTNAAYGLLTTPDKVTVNLPTDGLLMVAYDATWTTIGGSSAAPGDARAAIFLGANQVQIPGNVSGSGSPITQAAVGGIGPSLVSSSIGLVSASGNGYAPVDTGQILGAAILGNPVGLTFELGGGVVTYTNTVAAFGGPLLIRAAAGSYDVSVQFKSATGVEVKNRRLWAAALGF